MSKRSGLTLGELLLILLLLAVAVFVLAAYLLARREAARRTRCEANQQDLAKAVLAFEAKEGHYPGYVQAIGGAAGGKPLAGSWVVPLLPYRDQEDLFQQWRQGNRVAVRLPGLICPDDSYAFERPEDPVLSYAANCGRPGDEDAQAEGVFFNHTVARPVFISRDYLAQHDGAKITLLLSENLQAGYWTDTDEADLGMVWFREPGPCSPINRCRDAGFRPQDIQYARPSSNHPGGVMASYCDGHQQFLSDQIDYAIYQHLLTPDSAAAGLGP